MLMSYIVTQLYPIENLNLIDDIFKDQTWVDNSIYIKEDLLLSKEKRLESNLDLDKIFLKNVEDNFTFYSYCIPYSNTKIIISKMESGDFFKIHNNSIMYGDFFTEIYLNDPSDYEGGELNLLIDAEDRTFKLPKGYAITFKTGSLSKIEPVTSGERITARFYTKSLFNDEHVRDIYSKLLYLNTKFEFNPSLDNYNEVLNDPNYILNEIKDYFLYTHSILDEKKIT